MENINGEDMSYSLLEMAIATTVVYGVGEVLLCVAIWLFSKED